MQDLQADIRKSPSDAMRVVVFSNRTEFLDNIPHLDRSGITEIRRRLATSLFAEDPQDGGSSLADALRLAGTSIEAGRPGQVELHTDGLQTRGDAAAETKHLADRGIQVTVNSLKPSRCPIAQIADVRAPQSGAMGQSIPCEITIHASTDCLARLELLVESQPAESSANLSLHRGTQTVTLAMPLKREGLNQAESRLRSTDSVVTHDTAAVATWATPGSACW